MVGIWETAMYRTHDDGSQDGTVSTASRSARSRAPLMRRLFTLALSAVAGVDLGACAVGSSDGGSNVTDPGGGGTNASFQGLWYRITQDGSGDRTDMAVGTIPGEASDRVWLCEVRPSSSRTILQRGTLRGTRIDWDPVHAGVPSYSIGREGSRTWLQASAPGALRTFYDPGQWNRFCPPLGDTRLYVLFTIFGDGPAVSMTSVSTDIGCAANTVANREYGPCSQGSFTYSMSASNGVTVTRVPIGLSAPTDTAVRRVYSIGLVYVAGVGRYAAGWEYVDLPKGGATMVRHEGEGQVVSLNQAAPVAPAVRVTSNTGAPVPGLVVRFRVISGGGQITGESATTDAQGIARVGSWRMGSNPGANTLEARTFAVGGSPLVFTATGQSDILDRLGVTTRSSCALGQTGTLWCWGELGWTARQEHQSRWVPARSGSPLAFQQVVGGTLHLCGLTTGRRAYCFGLNNAGQVGVPLTSSLSFLPDSVRTTQTFNSLTAGGEHTCGLTATGAAWCWGANTYGQLGTGTTTSSTVPVLVAGGHTFAQLSAGGLHTCGVRTDGVALCWGANMELGTALGTGGQLGDGTTTNRTSPVMVSGSHVFAQVAAGGAHTCGRLTSGAIRCWGLNTSSQLGGAVPAATAQSLTPALVPGLSGQADVQSAGNATCARNSAGATSCWGQITATARWPTPTAIWGSYAQVAVAANHICARPMTGTNLVCWGQGGPWIGDGDQSDVARMQPTPVSPERMP